MLRLLFTGTGRVAAFTVHEPPDPAGTKLERAEQLLFVRDGFSWRAALFGPFYFLFRAEWLSLLIYIVAAVVLTVLLRLLGAGDQWTGWTMLLLNVIVGFEATDLKRWALARRGWHEIATVGGRDQEDAERRFFEAWLPTAPSDPAAEAHHGTVNAPGDDMTSRIEAATRRLSDRLRSRFAVKT
ncbi:DUF2628 domain-containing protein [Hyphomicrobium sp. CS1GBMeth3]|uniref:DUF2628 domain-containing protein n=1 Tax=Hyphomicrobium sp. CS1GBMeth3 TaxID=1892845 RepID=UPI000931BFC8|nr:DUF2628 domain-containing protein [Hyphomicrobium sp. CS1GBMeth3]